jgi:Fur family ferric uptake transcriptional regulator
MKEELKILRDHIRAAGLKQTSQRETILRIFLELPDFLTVDEIGRAVQDRDRRIGLSTVYRSLKLFVEAGLAWEHQFWHGKTCFEKAYGRRRHNYLICTRCLKVEAFSDPLIEAVRDKVAGAKGFKPSFNRMEVYGLCRTCRGPVSEEDED